MEVVTIYDDVPTNLDIFESIGVYNMWKHTKGEGVKIAVIDTGINVGHPEFKNSFISGLSTLENCVSIDDINSHGTSVSGLISGLNVGVAPESQLYMIKALDNNGNGSILSVMDGITYATNMNVDIICMSLGGMYEIPNIIKSRIINTRAEGITMLCASGNSGRREVCYPAKMEEVIAVGGIDRNMQRSSFSNHGEGLDIVAPSIDVISSYNNNQYSKFTGTSFSTAIATGAIALLISYYRKQGIRLTPTEIRNKLHSLNNYTVQTGHGLIDLNLLMN